MFSLEDLIAATSGKLSKQGKKTCLSQIKGFCIDTRVLKEGECFVALRSETNDGHRFLGNALEKKASVLLVDRTPQQNFSIPVVEVSDTMIAMENLARYLRKRSSIPFVGITGSLGKTTTKEMVSKILEEKYKVLRSPKSFNNHLGVPITLSKLSQDHEVAVMELGANDFGEIDFLSKIIMPDIGVITCIAPTHLEGFKNIDGIVKVKSELLAGMQSNGTLITNADDVRCMNIAKNFPGKVVSFGLKNGDITAEKVKISSEGLTFIFEGKSFHTKILGKHNIYNILIAIAVARELGLSTEDIQKKIPDLDLPPMRMEVRKIAGITVLNDSYNASPKSMISAVETLNYFPGKRKIAVLGSMLELGDSSEALHRETGKKIAEYSLDMIWAIGKEAKGFLEGSGKKLENIFHYNMVEEAIDDLLPQLQPEDVILLKASRKMRLETILQKLEQI